MESVCHAKLRTQAAMRTAASSPCLGVMRSPESRSPACTGTSSASHDTVLLYTKELRKALPIPAHSRIQPLHWRYAQPRQAQLCQQRHSQQRSAQLLQAHMTQQGGMHSSISIGVNDDALHSS
jgi:hypothetical protein